MSAIVYRLWMSTIVWMSAIVLIVSGSSVVWLFRAMSAVALFFF
jgi:hypothetical protein